MAKKKDSKVSIASVDKVLKTNANSCEVTVVAGEETLNITVQRYLNPVEFGAMVRDAAESMFMVNETTGDEEYDASLEDVVKADAILIYVANFKPEMSFDRVASILYGSTVMQEIYAVWNPCQRVAFEQAFEKQAAHHREMLIAGERKKLEFLSSKLDTAVEALNAMTQVFDGVSQEQIVGAFNTMSSLTGDELIEGVVRANNPGLKVIK